MHRQVVLDTETTGLKTEDGHRIIEIGCIEMVDRKLTGKHFHQYINPERPIDEGAAAIHGITEHFLRDKPTFKTIAEQLMAFIKGAELIIHNAPFDLGFLNYELTLLQTGYNAITEYCSVIDTLVIARRLHAGQRNNLDALCKRYHVDNTKRELHGALLDANLLAQVYLAMTGGQGNFFDNLNTFTHAQKISAPVKTVIQEKRNLIVLRAEPADNEAHENYLKYLQKQGKCLWLE